MWSKNLTRTDHFDQQIALPIEESVRSGHRRFTVCRFIYRQAIRSSTREHEAPFDVVVERYGTTELRLLPLQTALILRGRSPITLAQLVLAIL